MNTTFIYRDLTDLASFTEIARKSGCGFNYETVRLQITELNKNISSQLELPIAAKALYMEKLWKLNNERVFIERQYININLGILHYEDSIMDDSLIEMISNDSNLKAINREEEIKIVQSTDNESALLNIETESDLLLIKGRSFNVDSIPYEYYEVLCKPEYIKYRSFTSYETK